MKKKRLLSWFLTMVMVFGLLPTTIWAEEPESITANVTISNKGDLEIVNEAVEVVDINESGAFDIDDVLYAAHAKFYTDGAESGYSSYKGQYGLSIGKLWGDESGAFGYYVNDASALSLEDPVDDGDKVVAFVYKDTTGWSDTYSYFDQTSVKVKTDETLGLTLSAYVNWQLGLLEGATITVDGKTFVNEDGTAVKTDENGKIAISFDEAGSYLVSATHDTVTLVPPVCLVTVTDEQVPDSGTENEGETGTGGEDDGKIDQDKVPVEIKTLMENIAASYADNFGEWVVMDMAAYAELGLDSTKTSDTAKQKYINTAITSLNGGNVGETDYSKAILALTAIGIDAEKLYPEGSETPISAIAGLNDLNHGSSAWVAPYTLAAYNQKDYENIADYENAIISAVLANQQADGSWSEYGYTVQTTANVLAGLAFYQDRDDVKAAIEKAVAYLSAVQGEDGRFDDDPYGGGPDANTAAMVVIGLAAVGIDPADFVKNGHSAMDGLLSFALTDNSGFGYTNNTSFNSYATEQGFRALIAAKQVMDTDKAFNIYDFSHNTELKAGKFEKTEEKPPVDIPEDEEIVVSVSIDANGDDWLDEKYVSVAENATVYDAFMEALKGSGIRQKGASSGYIESMTKDGVTLGEFTEGENSGWLYKVNGKLPDIGIKDYKLDDGDDILFYYTEDWKSDPDAGSRFEEEIPEEEEATGNVSDLIDKIGEVILESADAIKAAREAYDALTDEEKALVENYDLLLAAEVLLAELLAAQEQAVLPAIEEIFTDMPADSYCYEAVQWAVANGIVSGVTETEFGPEWECSRGQLMTLIWRLMGKPEPRTQTIPYADVDKDMYYHDAILWAVENKLANGTDEISFSPEMTLTRGQAVAFLWRAAGMPEPAGIHTFADVTDTDYYAKAVQWAAENGITSGTGDGCFSPENPCTRGQIVTFLYRCYGK